MNQACWIWRYGDFERFHGAKCLTMREERGKSVPVFYEIPNYCHSARFRKTFELKNSEPFSVLYEGQKPCVLIDDERLKYADEYIMPAGSHTVTVIIGNYNGLCAVKICGKTVYSDSTWLADAYDGNWDQVGTSPLCTGDGKPGDFEFPTQRIIPVSDTLKDNERIIDLGKESYVKIRLRGLSGTGITDIFYGECLEETYSDRCVIIDSVKNEKEKMMRARACRYIRFTGDINFSFEAYYPRPQLNDVSDFKSDDKLLEKIYDVSKYTLELCNRLFILDGIKRDGWPWAGDLYVSAKMSYYSFCDAEAIKRTLILLRGNDTVKFPVNTIEDYSFYWIITLFEYYEYTGDIDFLKCNYTRTKQLIDYYIARNDSYGFIQSSENWVFIDWHEMDKSGDCCSLQMLYGKALKSVSQIAAVLGFDRDTAYYGKRYLQVYNAVNHYFWDETQGAYVSNMVDGKPTNEVRRHQNYFAVLFDYADESKKNSILKHVVNNEDVPQITTPFFKFFEYEVLCEYGMTEKVFDGIKLYWGGMLENGATTIWEEYNPELVGLSQYAMYGEPFDKSLCHAWGAGPIYFIGHYLLGIRPEKAGYEEFSVKPLTFADNYKVTVLLGRKEILVTWKNGTLEIRTTAPGGKLYFCGKTYIIEPGKLLHIEKN